MNLIISGRVLDGNCLIGYRAWLVQNTSNLEYRWIPREALSTVFEKYRVINCEYSTVLNSVKSTIALTILDYPRYSASMKLSRHNRYTEAYIIAHTLDKDIESVRILVCGALVQGAITEPLGARAIKHAEVYYEEIRHMKTDVSRIAKNTGFSGYDVNRVKNYLFMESHQLDDGYRRFDPSFVIATSWQRLLQNKFEPHDITLLRHELLEMELVASGMEQRTAHNYAENKFNYGKESNEYYDRIKKHH